MKIAIVTEASTTAKNAAIAEALKATGHEIINIGMHGVEGETPLSYIETGFIGAMLLNTGCADFVVGGCGTGQGFMNSVLQYPGVSCGLIAEPLDAWLFAQINGGNCISLALNKGYGWAGDVNLKFIMEKLFSVEFGCGYPDYRKEPQKEARIRLSELSERTHLKFGEIIDKMDQRLLSSALNYPGVRSVFEEYADEALEATKALEEKYNSIEG